MRPRGRRIAEPGKSSVSAVVDKEFYAIEHEFMHKQDIAQEFYRIVVDTWEYKVGVENGMFADEVEPDGQD